MKRIIYLLSFFVLLQGCKKDTEKSHEYWNNLASEKYKEIEKLSANYSCQDIDKLSIQTVYDYCPVEFLVHEKDLQHFNTLNEAYSKYRSEANKLQGDLAPLLLCIEEIPIEINCKDNKPRILKARDLDIEQTNTLIQNLTNELRVYQQQTACSNSNDWQYIYSLKTNCEPQYIPIPKSIFQNDKIALKKIRLLQELNYRKKELLGDNCSLPNNSNVLPIKCIDNKAVVISE